LHYYESGKLKYELFFENGKAYKGFVYNPNGQKRQMTEKEIISGEESK
jgi:antitoxin component YwqK of YwqJK toxin-antitoxin module